MGFSDLISSCTVKCMKNGKLLYKNYFDNIDFICLSSILVFIIVTGSLKISVKNMYKSIAYSKYYDSNK